MGGGSSMGGAGIAGAFTFDSTMISSVVTGITLFCIVFGLLLGLLRGRNRGILRFVLVLACAFAAFFLKDVLIDSFFALEIEGQTLEQTIAGAVTESAAIPEAFGEIVLALVRIIIGLTLFIILFLILKMVTWVIVFPILKIFVRKEKPKKKRLFGLIVGMVQGVLVAFVICSPITGMFVQMDRLTTALANFELGEQTEEMTLPDFDSYLNSPLGKVYASAGGWLFDAITTTVDSEGNTVKLDDTIGAVELGANVANEILNLSSSLQQLGDNQGDKTQSDILRDVAASLSNMDTALDGASVESKEILNTIVDSVKQIIGGEGGTGEGGSGEGSAFEEVFSNLDLNELDFGGVADAISGIADYYDYQESDEADKQLNEGAIESIVEGLATNEFILDLIEDEEIVEVDDEHKQEFQDAINATELSSEQKAKLAKILGLR